MPGDEPTAARVRATGRATGATNPAVVWIDGGARGNPGPAGCGVVIELADGHHEEHTVFLGVATNNEAEYAGLIAALTRAVALGIDSVEVRSDSELLVRQITGKYRVKAVNLQPLWLRARELASHFDRFAISHVRRGENALADRLANVAMDSGRSTLAAPPRTVRTARERA